MTKAIEENFPFEEIDPIAELESWRKEVNRPIYHIHKWWANRLGSVFRAIAIGSVAESNKNIWDSFYQENNFKGKVILDPFMGSGTTLGECAKLGIKPIGCDINPVSSFIVQQALTHVSPLELETEFLKIEKDVKDEILKYYRTLDASTGEEIQALYYFWVKVVTTPEGENIPLFSNHVFSKNAYPKRKPESQILCPHCWHVNVGRYDSTELKCSSCGKHSNPQEGPANRQTVTDSKGISHKIKDLVKESEEPPEHRMYAVMALRSNGKKVYQSVTDFDESLYEQATQRLAAETLPLPNMAVRPGHNTNQARGYNYLHWRQFFNDRQLLALGILMQRILEVENRPVRDQLMCLFSSTLEFNNLFCSFKGEGTGAVRHMFSHHILKPERTPLENTVWGTSKSSGTFSTLFKTRLLRAKNYLDQPFEIKKENGGGRKTSKIVCSKPIDIEVCDTWEGFTQKDNAALILNGDSSNLPIPDGSVDAVVTDPPYFDFVHYSELSDFFFAWLSPALQEEYRYFARQDSSGKGEVQQKNPDDFAKNLGRVYAEAYRTLKDDGLLLFSFHHSRPEGWLAIYKAIISAGFEIVSAHPVKGEMSVGSPKSAAKEPINLDAIMVCKKSHKDSVNPSEVQSLAEAKLAYYRSRFRSANRHLSMGDVRVILASQILVFSSLAELHTDNVGSLLDFIFKDTSLAA